MEYVVVGAGAIGGTIGARLGAYGHYVLYILRPGIDTLDTFRRTLE